jgi:acyl dehydratase
MMQTRPHERFAAEVSLDPRATSAFARAVGDTNPVHHDAELAAKSRFGRLIASSPQTTAHLLALTASHFSKRGAMLGLEFWVQFRRPVYADETITSGMARRRGQIQPPPRRRRHRSARPHSQANRRNRRGRQGPHTPHRKILNHHKKGN